MVLHREDGAWKIVREHASIDVRNEQAPGVWLWLGGDRPTTCLPWFTQRRSASREMPSCELTALQAAVVDP